MNPISMCLALSKSTLLMVSNVLHLSLHRGGVAGLGLTALLMIGNWSYHSQPVQEPLWQWLSSAGGEAPAAG